MFLFSIIFFIQNLKKVYKFGSIFFNWIFLFFICTDFSLQNADLGFPLKTISNNWFLDKDKFIVYKDFDFLAYENSIFKPQEIIQFDPAF